MESDADPIEVHRKLRGKISIAGKAEIKSSADLSVLYTPGVAKPCLEIAKDKALAYDMTMKGNTVAIVTDGSRVLGLGDIGPEAALPVMEGKALIMQQLAGIDAFPICLDEKDPEALVRIVKAIAPTFGAINLEDISMPKVFEIEARLIEELDIPVFHDDQHGTAIVVLSGLLNALKVLGKGKDVRIAVIGAGSAGSAIAKLLHAAGFPDIIVFDSKGPLHSGREMLDPHRKALASFNKQDYSGPLEDLQGMDIVISAAKPGALPLQLIRSMRKPNIVFALSNPESEITIEQARELAIDIFGTGHSDYPNQINNAFCFPGFLRALLDLRVKRITDRMKIAAAKGIAESVEFVSRDKVVPDAFDRSVPKNILERVR